MEVISDDLEQMYQEVILEASRQPHGKQHFARDLADERGASAQVTVSQPHVGCPVGQSHQFNPTCGDEVTVHVELSQEEPYRIERVIWDGQGCSISQASLSIMVDLVDGQGLDKTMALSQDFHALMQSRGAGVDDERAQSLGDAIVFQGVSKYPMRIKCALLGWEGLKDAVAQALAASDRRQDKE